MTRATETITTAAEANKALAEEIGRFYADPLGFVRFAYPWGEAGTSLEHHDGPDKWQTKFLIDVGNAVKARRFDGKNAVKPLRFAVGSGHGIGKSALVAWLVDWIMSTRPSAQGTITANTVKQLETKTWAQIKKWTALCITHEWFRITNDRMYGVGNPAEWFCSAQTCKEENSEAFAGQHAPNSTSFYIDDEASAIPDKIFEVSEGGLTDGEPMIFLFGNPTRNTGKFHRVIYGTERDGWNHRSIDSRTSKFANQAQIAEWIHDYGIDSDFVRVRVLGTPPHASEFQYIGLDIVRKAHENPALSLEDDPLIAGVDISGGGAAWNVVRFRRGFDARSIAPIRVSGAKGDRQSMIAKLAQVLAETDPEKRVAMMFIDSAFGSPIVERLHMLGYGERVAEVNFGGDSPDEHYLNMRAYMHFEMREWLPRGAIDKNDEKLTVDLTSAGSHFNRSNQLVIESKQEIVKRIGRSPDDSDALALTFAHPVAPVLLPPAPVIRQNATYAPFG